MSTESQAADFRRLNPRQDDGSASIKLATALTAVPSMASSGEDGSLGRKPLETATKPIPLAGTIGLIMPNPWQSLYAGVNYTFGFVDTIPRPAPTVGGWLRHVQPLLLFPDYKVNVFPASGQESPEDEGAVPFDAGGLCGATVEDFPVSYPFVFEDPGWYMFVINQTWLQATVTTDNICRLPLISQKSFFSTQTLSIAPRPTSAPYPVDPRSSYTVFADVTTQTPSRLPAELTKSSASQKLAVGFGVTGAVIALICIGGIVWWVRKKHKMEAETLAFSRLPQADQVAFLEDNPEHFLNPNRPSRSRCQPPPPPGTWAYAQWHNQQIWNGQLTNWRYGRSNPGHDWGARSAPPTFQGGQMMRHTHAYSAPHGGMRQPADEPVMVFKTY